MATFTTNSINIHRFVAFIYNNLEPLKITTLKRKKNGSTRRRTWTSRTSYETNRQSSRKPKGPGRLLLSYTVHPRKGWAS